MLTVQELEEVLDALQVFAAVNFCFMAGMRASPLC
jgi:hypothetical protein